MSLDRVGPYRLLQELGTGGMGTVYAAQVEGRSPGIETGTQVAIKVVHSHLLETPGFFKRFMREGEVGKSVRHRNVVRTYDTDALVVDGEHRHFLVMEFVEGQTLRDLLAELDRVPEELCRHIGREIARGLTAIHEANVVHRDLKPENVLITPDHEVKVMDLGVARLQDEVVRLSQTGAFVGSVHYAAPEQFGARGGVDHRADLHALGLLLYELGCGQHPYWDEDFRVVLKRLLHEEPRRVSEINPQLSPFYEEVVHTLIAKSQEERFQTAAELVAVLDDGEESDWWKERAKALRVETRQPLRRVRIARETALYGRESEIGKLRSLFADVKLGRGHVLVVEGEAGIGKTRVIDEFIGLLRQEGEDLNFLFGSYPPGGAATASGAFSTAYREQFGEAGLHETLAEYLQVTPSLIPAFAALLLGEATPKNEEPLTKDSLQTVFLHATRALAAERPTIVLIDDLHFSPDDGRALFAALAAAITHNPVLLIGTLRPGSAEDWQSEVQRLEHSAHMPIARLGPKDMFRVLQDTLRSERLAHDLAGQIAVKSDGNPFFVFEIVRGLRDGKFITQNEDGSWARTQVIHHIQIPSTVMDLIQSRIADLSEEEKDLLEVASCCGYEFDPGLVATALDMKRIPALKRFGAIEKTHRLVRSSGRHMVFDHYQVQEALYAGVLEQLREEYHAALAEALEARESAADRDPADLDGGLCLELCEQYFKGARNEQALRYLDRAVDFLETGYLNAQGAALLGRALAPPRLLIGDRRIACLLRQARLFSAIGRNPEQRAALDEALPLAEATEEPATIAGVLLQIATHLETTSRYEEVLDVLARARDCARQARDVGVEASVCGAAASALIRLARFEDAREQAELKLHLAQQDEDRGEEAGAAAELGRIQWHLGHHREGLAYFERQLAYARETGNRSTEESATGLTGIALAVLGRQREARARFEQAIALSRELGKRRSEAIARHNLGELLGRLGDTAGSRASLEESTALARETGDRLLLVHGMGALVVVADAEGRRDEALRLNGEALSIAREIGVPALVAAGLVMRGRLLASNGKHDEARDCLEEAQRVAREVGVPDSIALAACHLALLPGGDAARARATVDELGERMDHLFLTEAQFLLWRATADRAHLAEAKRLVEEALVNAPEEHRDAMLENVPLHRDIWKATQEAGL